MATSYIGMTQAEFIALPFEEQQRIANEFVALSPEQRKAIPFKEASLLYTQLMVQNLRERTLNPDDYPVTS